MKNNMKLISKNEINNSKILFKHSSHAKYKFVKDNMSKSTQKDIEYLVISNEKPMENSNKNEEIDKNSYCNNNIDKNKKTLKNISNTIFLILEFSHSMKNFFPDINPKKQQVTNEENQKEIETIFRNNWEENKENSTQNGNFNKRIISDYISDKFAIKNKTENRKRTTSYESFKFKENINLRYQNESIKSLQYFEGHVNNEIVEREKKKLISKQKSEEKISVFPMFQNDLIRINLRKSSIIKNSVETESKIKNLNETEASKKESTKFGGVKDTKNSNDKKEDIIEILKRVREKNLNEADVRNRTFYNNNVSNLKFRVINNYNNFIYSSFNKTNKLLKNNSLELFLTDKHLWDKHEQIWKSLCLKNFDFIYSYEFEKYIVPPNDNDILLSMYCTINNLSIDRLIISPSNTAHPRQEIIKWKDAFKKSLLRWHPDKIVDMLDKLNIKDEKKNMIIRKCGVYINNINKSIQTIIEHLRMISKNK